MLPTVSRRHSRLGLLPQSAWLRLQPLPSGYLSCPRCGKNRLRPQRRVLLDPYFGRMLHMSRSVLEGIEIASVASAVVTAVFAVAVRLLWRRGKSLREP